MSRSGRRQHTGTLAGLLGVVLLLGGCGDGAPSSAAPETGAASTEPTQRPPRTTPASESPTEPTPTPSPTKPTETTKAAEPPASEPPVEDLPFGGRRVLAISIDGLHPEALRRLGHEGAPAIWSLIDNGAATLDARTEVELTKTLPNHVGMITGRPVLPRSGGHGVDWNNHQTGRTVQGAAGGPVESIFSVVHDAGGSTGLFAGKAKFDIFEASWPDKLDYSLIAPRLPVLAEAVARDLRVERRTFTFVHIAEPDEVGHVVGWLSPGYLDSVREADALVGRLLSIVQRSAELRRGMVVVLTADHAGEDRGHDDETDPVNYTIPFVVAGAGVATGDLYDLSPGLSNPETSRPSYDGAQPVRNCDLANVATAALGLDPVPGSRCDGASAMPIEGP